MPVELFTQLQPPSELALLIAPVACSNAPPGGVGGRFGEEGTKTVDIAGVEEVEHVFSSWDGR